MAGPTQAFGMDTGFVRDDAGKIDNFNSELDSIIAKLNGIMGLILEKCSGELGEEFKSYYDENVLSKLTAEVESFRRVVQTVIFAANNTDDTTESVKSNIGSGLN